MDANDAEGVGRLWNASIVHDEAGVEKQHSI